MTFHGFKYQEKTSQGKRRDYTINILPLPKNERSMPVRGYQVIFAGQVSPPIKWTSAVGLICKAVIGEKDGKITGWTKMHGMKIIKMLGKGRARKKSQFHGVRGRMR